MPESIQLFRVFVATPSDVVEELQIIEELLGEWNRTQGPNLQARVEFANWKTHSHPAAGDRAQAHINKQVVDKSDLIVALFRGRFGSASGHAASGTVEEIERGIKQLKPVMVYFANLPEPIPTQTKTDAARINKFKKEFGEKALYYSYTSIGAFEKAFRLHLADSMREQMEKHKKS